VNYDAIIEPPKQEPKEPLSFRPVSELAERFDVRMAQAGEREASMGYEDDSEAHVADASEPEPSRS
jgi:hypothetical protein